MVWESRYESGKVVSIHGGHAGPGLVGKSVAVLYLKSMMGGLLEIRDRDSGQLIRAHPFVAKIPYSSAIKITSSKEAFACALRRRILIWRNDVPHPKSGIAVVNGGVAARPLPQGQRMVYATLSKERDSNTVSLVDFSKGDVAKGTIHSRTVKGFVIGRVGALSMDRSGTRFALCDSGVFGMYRISEDKILEIESPHKVPGLVGYLVALHPEGNLLWFGNKVFRFPSGGEVSTLKTGTAEFLSLAGGAGRWGVWVGEYHLVAPMLARVSAPAGEEEQRILARWNAQTGDQEAQATASQIACITASADGRWVVEGGGDKKVRIRDSRTLEVAHEFRAHEAGLCGLAWHPRLPLLSTCARDGVLRIWDTETWKIVEEILVGSGERVIQIPEDGKSLVVIHSSRLELYLPKTFQK